jgi:GTP-binding protein HflX
VEQVEYSETIDVVAVCTPKTVGQIKQFVEGYVEPKEPWEL